jgi:dipeptidyl aminopeptidase/acylaminoacyl peptidase
MFISLVASANALHPENKYVMKPERMGLMYKEMTIRTKDSLNLKAWFIPAQELLPIPKVLELRKNNEKRLYNSEGFTPKPTLILCDGDSGNMSYSIYLALEYIQNGFNVVLFDWRGFGESESFQMNENRLFYTEFLLDYEAVINTVISMDEVKTDCIGLYGFSTGAYLSFATAYKNSKIRCVVLRGLMTNFEDVLRVFTENKLVKYDKFITPKEYPNKICPINIASHFDKPSFLIVGENDNRTPVEMSKRIYELLPIEKELWIADGAGHGGAKAPEVKNKDEFLEKTIKFYKHYLENE